MRHVFISYVREDAVAVDEMQAALEAAGIRVWRDTSDLLPGQDRQTEIRDAISDSAIVFLACFSRAGLARRRSRQREELVLAIEELRLRSPRVPWLIPVRLDDSPVPLWNIGAGRTLTSLRGVDLFGDQRTEQLAGLIRAIREADRPQAGDVDPGAGPLLAKPRWPRRARTAAVVTAVAAGLVVTLTVLAAHRGDGILPPAQDGLAVLGSPWTAPGSGSGKEQVVTAGSPVRYAFRVDNSTGATISAGVRFDAYWGTIDQPPVNIYDILFQATIPPGQVTIYSPRTVVPGDALPGTYSEQADVGDSRNAADHAGQYGSFQVKGWKLLRVPELALPARLRLQPVYDGAACVAMVLKSRSPASPGLGGVHDFLVGAVAGHRERRPAGPAPGLALEQALEQFGVPDAAISQISLDGPNLPAAQVTAMGIAVKDDSAVVAFADGNDLPAPGTGSPDSTGLWLVVAGFGAGPSGAEVLIDDPADGDGARRVSLADFERAIADAATLPASQQEPDHIAGIVVSPAS